MYGYAKTGKSTTVRNVMRELDLNTIWINCLEIGSDSDFYMSVIKHAEHYCKLSMPRTTNWGTCSRYLDFMDRLKRIQSNLASPGPLYIVLDDVESLMKTGLVERILKLNEQMYVELDIGVVMITKGLSSTLSQCLQPYVPVYIHFPLFPKRR